METDIDWRNRKYLKSIVLLRSLTNISIEQFSEGKGDLTQTLGSETEKESKISCTTEHID